MKRLLSITLALTVLLGSLSGLILQTACIGAVTLALGASPTCAMSVMGGAFTLGFFMPSSHKGNYAMIVFTEGICEKVQDSLINILGTQNAPSLKRTQVGFLQALKSTQNTAGTSQVPVDPGNGKYKQVRIKYIQRGVATDLTTVKPTGCVTDLEKEPFEQIVAVTNYLGTKGMKFTQKEMRKLCEADSEFMAGVINAEIDPLIVQLNKNLLATQAANFGAFNPVYAGPFKPVTLLEGSLKRPVYYGESQILEDFENLDTNARPIVIGAGVLAHYARQVGIGCCNQDGINIGQAGNMDFFRDRYVDSELGQDYFIGLVPGYTQLLTWNEYVGEYAKENDVFSHGTIIDPVTGLKFDMRWHYNDCDDFYFVQFGLNYEMYYIPTNSFAYGDELNGVNFTLQYKGVAI